jgi:hypothetical protein
MRKLTIIEHISLDGLIQVSGEDGDKPKGTVSAVAPWENHISGSVVGVDHYRSCRVLRIYGVTVSPLRWRRGSSIVNKILLRFVKRSAFI